VPVHCIVIDGVVYHEPGYWVSPEGLTVLKESYEGATDKLEVVERVEVRTGFGPAQVVAVGVAALVVGVGGGVVVGVVVGQ
jgi:hypothetical protein